MPHVDWVKNSVQCELGWPRDFFIYLYVEINPYHAKFIYLNFHPLEDVSRYRGPHLQVGEN